VLKKRKGYPYFLDMPFDTICRDIIVNGAYEKELIAGMCTLVPQRRARSGRRRERGHHGVHFASRYDRVVCFEPVPSNLWILRPSAPQWHPQRDGGREGLVETARHLLHRTTTQEHQQRLVSGDALPDEREKSASRCARDDEVAAFELRSADPMIKIDRRRAGAAGDQRAWAKTIAQHRPMISGAFTAEASASRASAAIWATGTSITLPSASTRARCAIASRRCSALGLLRTLDSCTSFDGMTSRRPGVLPA